MNIMHITQFSPDMCVYAWERDMNTHTYVSMNMHVYILSKCPVSFQLKHECTQDIHMW